MKIGVIYQIKNFNTSCIYIGSSINFHKRKLEHISDLKRGIHHSPYMQRSYNKHGLEAFEFTILASCPEQYLKSLEQWFLNSLKPKYNMAKDAVRPRLGIKLTEERKKEISEFHTDNIYRLGSKASEETKKKMSLTRLGRKNSSLNTENMKHNPVCQYDKSGILLAEFCSITAAAKITGVPRQVISKVCRGKYYYGYGFHWEYKEIPNGIGKKIINIDTGEIFSSIKECSERLNIHVNSISNSLNGRSKSYKYLQYYKNVCKLKIQNYMNLQRVNELLQCFLNEGKLPKEVTLISTDTSSDYHEEKNQGEEGLKVEIYDIGEPEVFLKVRSATDSYGYDERVKEIIFVTKSTEKLTIYE